MFIVFRKDKIQSKVIRQRTRVFDKAGGIGELMWQWAIFVAEPVIDGGNAFLTGNRGSTNVELGNAFWPDYLRKVAGSRYMGLADFDISIEK